MQSTGSVQALAPRPAANATAKNFVRMTPRLLAVPSGSILTLPAADLERRRRMLLAAPGGCKANVGSIWGVGIPSSIVFISLGWI